MMSNPNPKPSAPEEITEAEIDEVLVEFGGDPRATIRALLQDRVTILVDADRSVSRGYVKGLFSEGARPVKDNGR